MAALVEPSLPEEIEEVEEEEVSFVASKTVVCHHSRL